MSNENPYEFWRHRETFKEVKKILRDVQEEARWHNIKAIEEKLFRLYSKMSFVFDNIPNEK